MKCTPIGATAEQARDAILSDSTPFNGADIALIKAVTDNIPDAGALTTIDANIDAIKTVTDALPVLTETGGTVTTDGTEQNVYINNAPAGVYSPRFVKIDTSNHTATETIVVREYYRIETGGAWILADSMAYPGVITPALIIIELSDTRYGVLVTLELTAGTNRDYVWEVTYE